MTHPAVRIVAGAFAFLALVHLLVGVDLVAGGDVIPGVAVIVVDGVTAVLMSAFVLAPRGAEAALARPVGARLNDGVAVAGYFLQVAIVYVFFGFFTIVQGAALAQALLRSGVNPAEDVEFVEATVLANQFVIFTVLVVGALSWFIMVEHRSGRDTARALRLTPLRVRDTAVGVLVGMLAYFALLLAISLGIELSGAGAPTNPQADALAAALSPLGIVVLSLMAGVGEELYFRGLLQPKVGNLAQAVLFGVVHISYLTPWQVFIPFAVGYGFGILRNRAGLWAAIILHVGFDLFAFFGRGLVDTTEVVAWLPL